MSTRRNFLSSIAFGSLILPAALPRFVLGEMPVTNDDRAWWVSMLGRVAEPVLVNLATGQLKSRMPAEAASGKKAERQKVMHLEALGRTVAGIAPWIVCTGAKGAEEQMRARFADLTRKALKSATDDNSRARIDFAAGGQNLVDAAFLAQGLARGRAELWDKLDADVRKRLVLALQSTRQFKPGESNWLLFSAMIEAFLASIGEEWHPEPIETAVRAHEAWYKGDGAYGDGPHFHWDYYNSFVIHPMLLEVLEMIRPVTNRWAEFNEPVQRRARRYAAVQERLIAPDGSFPPLGRSLAYRCGAFHLLALMALRRELPESVAPAQVRSALTAVIRRTLGASGTFDDQGWLRIGLAGHQPSLGERYISTGSLYLCTLAFLPLGLSPADPFWTAPPAEWTSLRVWSGSDLAADHAID